MVCGSSNYVGNIYGLSLQYDETKNMRASFSKSQDITSGMWVLDFPTLKESLPDLRQEVIFWGAIIVPMLLEGSFF